MDQAQQLRNLVNNRQEEVQNKQNRENYNFNRNIVGRPRIIAISSGKGGVGKTNITVNLAIALSMAGQRVMIIDVDLGMSNVDVILGMTSRNSLLDLLKPGYQLADVLVDGPCGVKYLSGGSGFEQLVNVGNAELNAIIKKLGVCDAEADIILLDTGAGISENVMRFVAAADELILVTTPEPTAMTNAYALMKAYMHNIGKEQISLVVNRVYDYGEGVTIFNKLSKTAEKFLNLRMKFLGEIYEDRNLVKAVREQVPVLLLYPNAASAMGIKKLAENVLSGQSAVYAKGFEGFLKRFVSFLR